MVKSLSAIVVLILLMGLLVPLNDLSGGTVVTLSGKSSGEFINKKDLNVDNFFDLEGVSFSLSSRLEVDVIVEKLDAKQTHYFFDGEVENYYFFSEKLPKKEVIAGKKVNLHLAINKNSITLGSPIIYFGY